MGDIYGGLDVYYYPAMMTYIAPGTYTGVDYAVGFQPTTASGALQWMGGCPVDALPYGILGLTQGSNTIQRLDDKGSWYAQYTALYTDTMDYGKYGGSDIYIEWLYSLNQTNAVEWSETLELAP